MKNRAKCKLCQSTIESFHMYDYVTCKCGEIFVDGGPELICGSNDWNNFLRVDDEGNEIIVKVGDKLKEGHKESSPKEFQSSKPTKKELIDMLEEMVKNIENLPPQAMSTPINHYDLASALLLLLSIFRSDLKDEI